METLTLQEILEREYSILVDSSVTSTGGFLEKIYRCGYYQQLNLDDLVEAEKNLNNFLEFVSSGQVRVVPEVVEELKHFQRILSEKAKLFNENEKFLRKNSRDKFKDVTEIRKFFNNLCYLSNEILKKARKALYKPKNSFSYEALAEIVRTITDNAKLRKKQTFDELEPRPYRKTYQNNHADKTLVAALLNTSLEGEKTAVVSRDGDILLIFYVSYRLITTPELHPSNKWLVKQLLDNPSKIYLPPVPLDGNPDRYRLKLSTNEISPLPKFVIYGISEEENKNVKNKIKDILSRIDCY